MEKMLPVLYMQGTLDKSSKGQNESKGQQIRFDYTKKLLHRQKQNQMKWWPTYGRTYFVLYLDIPVNNQNIYAAHRIP